MNIPAWLKYSFIVFFVSVIGIGALSYWYVLYRVPTAWTEDAEHLEKASVEFGQARFSVEIADTPSTRELGLSYRDSLDEDAGMLFVFPTSTKLSFWMRGMKFPLDLIFLKKKRIIYIAEKVPPPNGGVPEIVHAPETADMVLEINSGLAEAYGIEVGDEMLLHE